MVDVLERDVIDYFINDLRERYTLNNFVRNKLYNADDFHRMVHRLINAKEQSREKFSDRNHRDNHDSE